MCRLLWYSYLYDGLGNYFCTKPQLPGSFGIKVMLDRNWWNAEGKIQLWQ